MKLIAVVHILTLVACFAGNCACISSGKAVVSQSARSYQVAVLCPVIMCSGAIVSPKNVLTTATCINYLLPEDVNVHVGSITYYSGGVTLNVANIVTHPKFSTATYESNLAVLTVDTLFDFGSPDIQPIPLANTLPASDSIVIVTGFGAVNPSLKLPDVLQRANLKLFSRTLCQRYKSNRMTTSMFCAGDTSGEKDTCPADQGAPLVFENQLIGIYSWGASCGLASPNPSSPVFNSIPFFRNWIQSIIAAL